MTVAGWLMRLTQLQTDAKQDGMLRQVILNKPLILASSSPARRALLTQARLAFSWQPSPFDEEAAKANVAAMSIPEQCVFLAEGKARVVSVANPDAWVLGGDQIAELDGEALFKPGHVAANEAILARLAGRSHRQHCAACLYLNGELVQRFYECITLTMRDLSEAEIKGYVAADRPMDCCAGYRYEQLGKWLFAKVAGSTEGIMGLPLQPIVCYLAQHVA